MKSRYQEGDWFAVPLVSNGFALGVVARSKHPRRRSIALGYFFGPELQEIPTLTIAQTLAPGDAILVCRFANDVIRDGAWPIIGRLSSWDRAAWELSEIIVKDILLPMNWSIHLDVEDPSREIGRVRSSATVDHRVRAGLVDGFWVAGTLTSYLRRGGGAVPYLP